MAITDARNNYLKFPIDLGTDQQGHFMNFVISPAGGGQQTTISMFIPGGAINGNLQWTSQHEYDEVKLTKLGMGMIGAVSQTAETTIGALAGAARLAGKGAINPKVDVLYSNTRLREFDFQFFMAPASADEGQRMKQIIDTFRLYSSPGLTGSISQIPGGVGAALQTAINQGGLNNLAAGQLSTGFWFTPPAEIEISFYSYTNGQAYENQNFPRIARCVIESVSVDYTGNGAELSMFNDGSPTTALLSMRFREMRVITQDDILSGY